MKATNQNTTELFDVIAKRLDAYAVEQREDEYIGEDGLLRCKVCNGPRQVSLAHVGLDRVVRCDCGCKQAEYDAYKLQMQREKNERAHRACFQNAENMATWTFENDWRKKPELSDQMARYAEQFAEYRESGQGLLLYGPTGTGKTYLAACIANRVIDMGYTAYMTNFSQVVDALQEVFEKKTFIESLCKYDLLVIDDLGTERKTEYMQEQVFKIIDARYRHGKPLIVTSNLTAEELDKPAAIEVARIYDRVLERCLPVKVEGERYRRQTAKTSWGEMRARLGMEARK